MIAVEHDRVRSELKAVPMFRRLSDEALDQVAAIAHGRRVGSGEVLFRQGEPGDEMVVLLHGSLRVSATFKGSDELCLAVAGPGEVLGEMALIDGHPRCATVTALEDCDVIAIDRENFQRLLGEQPDVSIGLLKCMTQRVRQTTEHATDIAHLDIYQRLLRQLRRLAAEHGEALPDGGVRIPHPMPLDTLARMIAARGSAVTRFVEMLEADGVLTFADDHFVIHDVERLSAQATPLMY